MGLWNMWDIVSFRAPIAYTSCICFLPFSPHLCTETRWCCITYVVIPCSMDSRATSRYKWLQLAVTQGPQKGALPEIPIFISSLTHITACTCQNFYKVCGHQHWDINTCIPYSPTHCIVELLAVVTASFGAKMAHKVMKGGITISLIQCWGVTPNQIVLFTNRKKFWNPHE